MSWSTGSLCIKDCLQGTVSKLTFVRLVKSTVWIEQGSKGEGVNYLYFDQFVFLYIFIRFKVIDMSLAHILFVEV